MGAKTSKKLDMAVGTVLREASLAGIGSREWSGQLEALEVVNEPGRLENDEKQSAPQECCIARGPLRGSRRGSRVLGLLFL